MVTGLFSAGIGGIAGGTGTPLGRGEDVAVGVGDGVRAGVGVAVGVGVGGLGVGVGGIGVGVGGSGVGVGEAVAAGVVVGIGVAPWLCTLTFVRSAANTWTAAEDFEAKTVFVETPREAMAVIVCRPSLISVDLQGMV